MQVEKDARSETEEDVDVNSHTDDETTSKPTPKPGHGCSIPSHAANNGSVQKQLKSCGPEYAPCYLFKFFLNAVT